ncbi:MAG: hypothetical protein RBS07_15190 [Lentimicrobium sp.]|jgi:hypothetical protein|nr:hypothetical protein [Lentimicrobium sp.]
MKYRKKPVVIEAVELRKDNIKEVEEFIEGHKIKLDRKIEQDKFEDYEHILIKHGGRQIETLEGIMEARTI